MADVLTDNTNYKLIADAIRGKNGKSTLYKPAEMPGAIAALSVGTALEPLDNPASNLEILNGYQAYDSNGQIVEGIFNAESPTIVFDYVVGSPVEVTLTGWDPDLQGTTYKLVCTGYKIGDGGLQLGLPSDSSTVNTQAVVAAALTIVNTEVTEPNQENQRAGKTTVTISAVSAPERDLVIALFGLEEVEQVEVTDAAVIGVTPPVSGEYPVEEIDNDQYSGTITWSPDLADGRFAPNTTYTATITLTAKPGYTFTGVDANFFTVSGASSVSNSADTGGVTAKFPATGTATVWERTISGVTQPAAGEAPVSTVKEDTNFTGTVSWSPAVSGGAFAANTVYTATITLKAKSGFTFTGVEENSFYVSNADTATNAADSGVVTAVFPATGEVTA